MRKYWNSTVLTGVAFMLGYTQFGSLPQADAAVTLEEITVTARKREENLQSTPVSVIALGGAALDTRNVTDLSDLNARLPNVSIGSAGGIGNNAAFFIRGLGTDRHAVNQESAVALYVDDFYMGRSDGALLSVVDVERIEVMRGPQGTLFGRNASAGAIRYITKKPDYEDTSIKLKADLGTREKINLSASANVAVADNTAVRLLAATINQDGYVTNALGQKLGDKGTNVFRGYVRTSPSERFEILAQVDYSKTDRNGAASQGVILDPDTRKVVDYVSGDPNVSTSAVDVFDENDTIGLGLTLNWHFNDEIAVKWVSTYRDINAAGAFDFDGRGIQGPHFVFDTYGMDRNTESWSSEMQLSGSYDTVKWIAGLFYYSEDSNDLTFQGTGIRNTLYHNLDSIGAFGQVDFDVTDSLSISAGLRYTRDKKKAAFREAGLNPGAMVGSTNMTDYTFISFGGSTIVSNEDKWSAISGRLALEYQINDDVYVFGSYSRGFRSGGINDRPLLSAGGNNNWGVTSFDEEILDVFELGLRSEWFNNRLRFNLTAFYQDMKDLQIGYAIDSLPGSPRVVSNAAKARSKGFEGEVVLAATDNLTFDATFGILDAEFKDADPALTGGLMPGITLPNSPNFKSNVGINYARDLASGTINVRLDWSYEDEKISAPTAILVQESYHLLGFNVAYTPAGEGWKVAAYGTNITDEDYYNFGVSAGPGTMVFPARGAEFGVRLELNL